MFTLTYYFTLYVLRNNICSNFSICIYTAETNTDNIYKIYDL